MLIHSHRRGIYARQHPQSKDEERYHRVYEASHVFDRVANGLPTEEDRF